VLHLGDEPGALGRRDRDASARAGDLLGELLGEVVEDDVEHTERLRRLERLGPDCRRPLVDGGGAHLHRRRLTGAAADDAAPEPVGRQCLDLGGPRPREVEHRVAAG